MAPEVRSPRPRRRSQQIDHGGLAREARKQFSKVADPFTPTRLSISKTLQNRRNTSWSLAALTVDRLTCGPVQKKQQVNLKLRHQKTLVATTRPALPPGFRRQQIPPKECALSPGIAVVSHTDAAICKIIWIDKGSQRCQRDFRGIISSYDEYRKSSLTPAKRSLPWLE